MTAVGSSDRRARDTDRDLAVDFVAAAWADGQLAREEYEVRVDRLLRATTLAELEEEVRDLQGPDGLPWHPEETGSPEDSPYAALLRPLAEPDAGEKSDVELPRRRTLVVAAATTVAGLALVAWPVLTGDEQAREPSDAVSAVSAEGYERLVDAMADDLGTTSVFSARLTSESAVLVTPTDPGGTSAELLDWDGEAFSEVTGTSSDVARLDLAAVDGATVERVVRETVEASGGDADDVVVTLSRGVAGSGGSGSGSGDAATCIVGELDAPGAGATTGLRDVESVRLTFDCEGRRVD